MDAGELRLGIAGDDDRQTKTKTVIRSRRNFGRLIGGGRFWRVDSVGLYGLKLAAWIGWIGQLTMDAGIGERLGTLFILA